MNEQDNSGPCPTPETHNWGCGCPSDITAAIASCPGYEMNGPSPCRCPCYGCKHHCAAHDPGNVDTPAPAPADVRDQIAAALDGLRDSGAVYAIDDAERDRIADAVLRVPVIAAAVTAAPALREVTPGYCGHCGRGDCSPTAEQWLAERQRAERAEATVKRVVDLQGHWTAAGPPPIGTPMARWWDRRLADLNAALDPREQP